MSAYSHRPWAVREGGRANRETLPANQYQERTAQQLLAVAQRRRLHERSARRRLVQQDVPWDPLMNVPAHTTRTGSTEGQSTPFPRPPIRHTSVGAPPARMWRSRALRDRRHLPMPLRSSPPLRILAVRPRSDDKSDTASNTAVVSQEQEDPEPGRPDEQVQHKDDLKNDADMHGPTKIHPLQILEAGLYSRIMLGLVVTALERWG